MLTVLVTNTKGGCGKTTVAVNLAAAFANAGLKTVLADCDRQKSSLRWAARRPDTAAPIAAANWLKRAARAPKGTQRLVIDAPAGLPPKQAKALVRRADVVVLPVLPSVFDEITTRRYLAVLAKLKPVRKGRRPVAIVGNRVRARTKEAQRLDAYLDKIGHRAVARLRDTQIYATAAASGLGLFDLNTRHAANFRRDWEPLLSFFDRTAAKLDR